MRFKFFLNSEEGVSSIEYALIAVLIAGVIFLTITEIGITLMNGYQFIANMFRR